MRKFLRRAEGGAGIVIFAASTVLLAIGLPFMKTWYYCFAWWSFILVLDAWERRKSGRSFLLDAPKDFFFTAAVSVAVWVVFEYFNLRLQNWSYHGVPAVRAVRWAGYALAFATVIPALKLLAGHFERGFASAIRPARPVRMTPAGRGALIAGGVLALALPLLWPRLFFPLVWIGFALWLDPVNDLKGRPSLLRDIAEGRLGRLAAWAAAGLAAGLCWELLNFWAGSHWEYRLPYLNFGRVFQMPVFGYGGFVPFALEVFAIDAAIRALFGAVRRSRIQRVAFWAVLVLFILAGFYLIDIISLVQ
jgi:hypothetical protein